jgi:hypothetical protein
MKKTTTNITSQRIAICNCNVKNEIKPPHWGGKLFKNISCKHHFNQQSKDVAGFPMIICNCAHCGLGFKSDFVLATQKIKKLLAVCFQKVAIGMHGTFESEK